MTRTPSGSLPWMVAVVVAAAIAGAGSVSGVAAELPDPFVHSSVGLSRADLLPAVEDSREARRPATAEPTECLTLDAADEAVPLELASAPTLEPAAPDHPADGAMPVAFAHDVALDRDRPLPLSLEFALANAIAEDTILLTAADDELPGEGMRALLAQAQASEPDLEVPEIVEYDPWMPFNESMFGFNRQVDRFVIKPVATVWDKILPDAVQQSLSRAFDNLAMPRRFVNKLFQLRFPAAGLELTRFLLNTTVGIAGFFDVAKEIGIEKKEADTGQTFGVYGAGPGPYLILPFLPPLTVRDGIGAAADIALDPLNYFIPLAASLGRGAGNAVNERSLNLELYQNVEETVVDLYSAVRNGYLQRRHKLIQDGRQEQPFR